jgi:hypothetical protein
MTGDFDTAVRSILGQLIEAREDQNDADKRLHDYRAANTPPEVPNEFENVDTFLDYHHRRQFYENGLRQHKNALKKAKKEYAGAADQLLLFLPEGAPLRYTYEGERRELLSTEYVLVRPESKTPAPATAEFRRGLWRYSAK